MNENNGKFDRVEDQLGSDEIPTIEIVQDDDAASDLPPSAGGRGSAAEPSAAGDPDRLAERLKALEAERDRLSDAWLRARADLDNYRKRTEREREEYRRAATEAFVLDLLPVLDNFDRALESLPPDAPRGFATGIELIHKQLVDFLTRQGVSTVPAAGEMFDPRLHEAVETESRTDVPHHQILIERQRGYFLGKRVLRPARVRVAVRPEADAEEGADDGQESAT